MHRNGQRGSPYVLNVAQSRGRLPSSPLALPPVKLPCIIGAARCELVLRELKRIQMEELEGRRLLEARGAQDPSKQGLELPKFGLGLIDQDTEEYDERVSLHLGSRRASQRAAPRSHASQRQARGGRECWQWQLVSAPSC